VYSLKGKTKGKEEERENRERRGMQEREKEYCVLSQREDEGKGGREGE
jgi:hypothetical protein